jgi:hypothetical protein
LSCLYETKSTENNQRQYFGATNSRDEAFSMSNEISRRAAIKGGVALVGLAALGIPPWPVAQAGVEEVIPWTDVPQDFDPSAGAGPHSLDTRTIQKSSFITPVDQFFSVQHYGPTQVDTTTYKLRVSSRHAND